MKGSVMFLGKLVGVFFDLIGDTLDKFPEIRITDTVSRQEFVHPLYATNGPHRFTKQNPIEP